MHQHYRIPLSMVDTSEDLKKILGLVYTRSKSKSWATVFGAYPADNRVMLTFHENHLALHYRLGRPS